MRKYYLFLIKEEVASLYDKHPFTLFQTLENLYRFKMSHSKYGVSLYNSICEYIDQDLLHSYIKNRFKEGYGLHPNRYLIKGKKEKDLIQVTASCVILLSNRNVPSILKMFYWYQKRIFVCDFAGKDYFWIKNLYHKEKQNIIE